eukprot:CAMPEP_0194254980 /NCGR_PEP_ID=MMETSP0158-20130606/33318_1 /TAXON_ID=33649 /ORGANISM="Thalassionema nitzschioides, Strain L26-B" /LENGTH=237 /DNA_ID=CAMNT_0038993197 /DNA_START=64 /DNA_END=777 /DNA_ORIENTATION=-
MGILYNDERQSEGISKDCSSCLADLSHISDPDEEIVFLEHTTLSVDYSSLLSEISEPQNNNDDEHVLEHFSCDDTETISSAIIQMKNKEAERLAQQVNLIFGIKGTYSSTKEQKETKRNSDHHENSSMAIRLQAMARGHLIRKRQSRTMDQSSLAETSMEEEEECTLSSNLVGSKSLATGSLQAHHSMLSVSKSGSLLIIGVVVDQHLVNAILGAVFVALITVGIRKLIPLLLLLER